MTPNASTAAEESRGRLLDAAERILVRDGHAGVTTRRVGAEAGLNHGLIHYYFGSLDELFVQVFDRFTERLLERQRVLYSADVPFLEKWRAAMSYLEEDVSDGYQKVWAELYNRSLSRPHLGPRLAAGYEGWRSILQEAFAQPYEDLDMASTGLSMEDLVTLVVTFNAGLGMEMLAGVRTGHRSLLRAIESLLSARSAA